jgi:phthiocerol/phenolphthiocerol synthesis type-I polyketide synthase E
MDGQSIPALAIIGMTGRFPGGHGLGDFWALLEQGRSAVHRLSDRELREAGVDEALLSNPAYVKCCVPLAGPDLFDAAFFGYSPRQAASIDPQQRLFLECAWEALEAAGYGCIPPGIVAGVFGGSGQNGYLARSLFEDFRSDPQNLQQSIEDADKDYLTGRVAYKLGLAGPAITVQTGCSTSLVAVHLASQSLLSCECDLALAGGASVLLPPHTGYLHVEGSIQSRDGACRAFDAEASGTIRGNAAAVVVLRRLADAQADGDPVLAIIRCTAANNDGSRKVGFTAPGLDSQVRLLRTGLELAELSPADIDFVEAHGTATALGDSIELTALQEVYASRRALRKPCVLGSVKTNIGHTDTASGVAGLIKTVLCLQHRVIVPNVGFQRSSALLASEESVFRVCSALEAWPVEGSRPRRAAVSSFGIGGTNAHVIVEEAAELPPPEAGEQAELLPISARTRSALEQSCNNLAAHLEMNEPPVPDVAFTLQVGRRAFDHRRFIVGTDRKEIVAALRTPVKEHVLTGSSRGPVIFLFPGQGAQRRGMLADVYDTDRELSQEVDFCAQRLLDRPGFDLRQVLCRHTGAVELDIDDTSVAQPALFVAEYCLARFWMRQGLTPATVLGHSVGEYAAACIAGVLGIEDALRLVAHRARASRGLPDGAMVAINLPEADVKPLLTPGVQITAVNASQQCVISGDVGAMQELLARLTVRGVDFQRLAVSKPFHTQAAAPLAQGVLELARQLSLSAARIPWVSSVTGARMSEAESTDPEHWARHVLRPVRFAAALQALEGRDNSVFLEVGPGRVLTGLARRELGSASSFVSLPAEGRSARADLLATLGKLWLAGAGVDFAAQPRRGRRRVQLPSHPLERRSHLKGSRPGEERRRHSPPHSTGARLAPEHWFNLPSWQRSLFPTAASYDAAKGAWLLLTDKEDFADSLAGKLRGAGQEVICLRHAARLAFHSRDEYELGVDAPENFDEIFARLDREGRQIGRIVHCATLSASADGSFGSVTSLPGTALSLAQVARVASLRRRPQPLSLLLVTNQLHDVSGYEQPHPSKGALPVFCRCIAQALPGIRCAVVDLPPPVEGQGLSMQYARYADPLLAELDSAHDPTVAYRKDWRFVQIYSAVELPADSPPLRRLMLGGCYVITGGLGRLGLALGTRLARDCQARLLLIARGSLPERHKWKAIAESESRSDPTVSRVRQLLQMEAYGSEVMVATEDVADARALREVLARAEERFGPVQGVFHLAADLGHVSRVRRMTELDSTDLAAQLRPKAAGLQALIEALGSRRIDFGVAFSSTSAILGGVGYGAYAAANAVMDSMILSRADGRLGSWMSLNWDGWLAPGATPDPYAIGIDEGLDALWRACQCSSAPQMVVSATPLEPRIDTWVRTKRAAQPEYPAPVALVPAEADAVSKVLPRTGLERRIAEIWQELLGIETIGVTESFLDLGGDSLIGVRVISRVKEAFRVSLTPASLLKQNGTVEALSRDVVRAMAEMQSVAPGAGRTSAAVAAP